MFFKNKILRRYRQKLQKLKTRYKDNIDRERNEFISILNHDIKTPVLAQKQSLEHVLSNLPSDIPFFQKEIIEEIANSNNFLLEVITNAIFLIKLEHEKPELKFENINIIEQIKDCASLIQNRALDKRQNIIIKSGKNKNINLFADKKFIRKIIINLLSSSINYGFENTDIEVSINENKKTLSFCTKNKSVYMTKEKINSLFEERKNMCDFNQLGMSLNLNIAKKLINAHNWEIIAKSDKNNSCVFGFSIKKADEFAKINHHKNGYEIH